MVSFFLWGVGLEEFGAEGVVVAEVFEVGGGWVGFEGGGVGGEGVKKAAWERGGFQAAAYLD